MLAALQQEAQVLALHLKLSAVDGPKISVWEGDLNGAPIVLALSGVGKVAAAAATQFLCDAIKPRCVLCIGLAGATGNDADRGHVIIASGAVQHDMDARPLTKAKGIIPGLGISVFPADPILSEKLLEAARHAVGRPAVIRSGLVLTGDQIVTSAAVRDDLKRVFPEAVCLDMETAAVAQVAHQNGLPWAALRVTSDAADETFNLHDVLDFGADTAGELFERIIRRFVSGL